MQNEDKADGLFICEDDVYIAGSICEGTSMTDCPTLWKNGIPQSIGEIGNFNNASSVFVDGNDIYAAINENDIGYLWKNGAITHGHIDMGYQIKALASTSDTLYIAGTGKDMVPIWKITDER